MGKAHDAHARIQEPMVFLQNDLAAIVDRDRANHRAAFFRDELPRDDVGVVLERREQNLIAVLEKLRP